MDTFYVQDVRHDLAPKRATRPAFTQDDGHLHLEAASLHELEVVQHRVTNAFHHGAHPMTTTMVKAEPEDHAARVGIPDRRALAHEIR